MTTNEYAAKKISKVVNLTFQESKITDFGRLELTQYLKKNGCPYSDFITPYLHKQGCIVKIGSKRNKQNQKIETYSFVKEKFPIHYSNFVTLLNNAKNRSMAVRFQNLYIAKVTAEEDGNDIPVCSKHIDYHYTKSDFKNSPARIFDIFTERELIELLRTRGINIKATMEL